MNQIPWLQSPSSSADTIHLLRHDTNENKRKSHASPRPRDTSWILRYLSLPYLPHPIDHKSHQLNLLNISQIHSPGPSHHYIYPKGQQQPLPWLPIHVLRAYYVLALDACLLISLSHDSQLGEVGAIIIRLILWKGKRKAPRWTLSNPFSPRGHQKTYNSHHFLA